MTLCRTWRALPSILIFLGLWLQIVCFPVCLIQHALHDQNVGCEAQLSKSSHGLRKSRVFVWRWSPSPAPSTIASCQCGEPFEKKSWIHPPPMLEASPDHPFLAMNILSASLQKNQDILLAGKSQWAKILFIKSKETNATVMEILINFACMWQNGQFWVVAPQKLIKVIKGFTAQQGVSLLKAPSIWSKSTLQNPWEQACCCLMTPMTMIWSPKPYQTMGICLS